MDKDDFLIKSHCQLGITSQEIDPKTISKLLDIEPSSSYSKGEKFTSKRSGFVAKRFQNIWAIKSETLISEKEDISPHILYFKSLLENKMDVLSELKKDPLYDISFWIWIETDNAGIGIDLSNDELSFINSISNRIHISLIASRTI
ncbi:MAG: DUF4279 domain-containing protein [Salinivirgaceae bacterium]|nr:DUF4279 domain-containing protein [Salinivirgaceae bacterium]